MDWRMKDALEAWDALVTFTSYERGIPKRVAAFRRDYEIAGNLDDWLENKFANVIDEYSKLTGLSFKRAEGALMERPVKRAQK